MKAFSRSIFLVFLILFSFSACKKKNQEPSNNCHDPNSICNLLAGKWWVNCDSLSWYTFGGGDRGLYKIGYGPYTNNPGVGDASYTLSGNKVTISAYRVQPFTKEIINITTDSIFWADGTKGCKCYLPKSGLIEGIVNGNLHTAEYSTIDNLNNYQNSSRTLYLTKITKYRTGDWYFTIKNIDVNSITFPYKVPESDGIIYFSFMGGYYNSVSPQIEITSYSENTVEGNFSCKLIRTSGTTYKKDELGVTNGYFSVKLNP